MKDQIASFIDSLKSNQKIASFDEASIKQAVVLRLLSFLGWDTFDVDEVTPEYSVKAQRVDYSLRLNNINKAFIEVKNASEELEKHQEQLLNYSFQEGVKLSILTNGITWWFYLPLNEGSWEQRKFYSIDLLQQRSEDIVLRLIDFLSKDNTRTGDSIKNAETIYRSQQKKNIVRDTLPKAWDMILSEPDELLLELLSQTTEKICGYRAEIDLIENFLSKYRNKWLVSDIPISRVILPSGRKRIELPKVAQLSENYTGKSISSFSFVGETYEARYWIDMLLKLCGIFVSRHGKEFDKVLALAGRKRPYFTYNANELRVPQRIEKTDIYVETNLSSNGIVKMCMRLLSLFGYGSGDLKISSQ